MGVELAMMDPGLVKSLESCEEIEYCPVVFTLALN